MLSVWIKDTDSSAEIITSDIESDSELNTQGSESPQLSPEQSPTNSVDELQLSPSLENLRMQLQQVLEQNPNINEIEIIKLVIKIKKGMQRPKSPLSISNN